MKSRAARPLTRTRAFDSILCSTSRRGGEKRTAGNKSMRLSGRAWQWCPGGEVTLAVVRSEHFSLKKSKEQV